MNLIAVDPGKHANAYARFVKGFLVGVDKIKHINSPSHSHFYGYKVVVESQQIYRYMVEDPNDLIAVAHGAGQVMGIVGQIGLEVELVLPSTWKGQVPKDIHHPRIRAKLDSAELALLDGLNKGQLKDILDAVGIGLWWLKKEGIRG